SGTLIIPAGATSGNILIPILGDSLNEPDETFKVTLSSPINAVITGSTTATITIQNDDAVPALSITDMTIAEGNTGTKTVTFTAQLSTASGLPVTVQYATADGTATAGSDYTATSGTLSFTAGLVSKTFTVTILGDMSVESDEYALINLSNPTNAT